MYNIFMLKCLDLQFQCLHKGIQHEHHVALEPRLKSISLDLWLVHQQRIAYDSWKTKRHPCRGTFVVILVFES